MRGPISFLIFIVLPFLPLSDGSFSAPPDMGPPNILFMIADDWSYPHAGILGDKVVRTPTFDKLARDGALFHNAYCSSPSCSPSRASILTGKYPHQLGEAGNLWSVISKDHPNWMSILANSGYHTGKAGKGWGPGDYIKGGYTHNPAGMEYKSFDDFLSAKLAGQPFAFWFGSTDPHRPYETNSGVTTGMDPAAVEVPGFLPDHSCVRNDIMDYYFEVERFDRECGALLERLKQEGLLDNTIIVMTSDNGMPFPRAKANLYDYGTRMPLAVCWSRKISPGTEIREFMNFVDFAPTMLEAAGLEAAPSFSGKSLMDLLTKTPSMADRDRVFLERERHANVRKGNLSYPMRAVRTHDYLYIRNFEPDRWPAGDPSTHQSVGQFGDVDNSITKFLIMAGEKQESGSPFFEQAFGKRPPEELYVLSEDPFNLKNIAADPKYESIRLSLRDSLSAWMKKTNDPRSEQPKTLFWDQALYTPDYQHHDFDLEQELRTYRGLRRDGYSSFREYPCIP